MRAALFLLNSPKLRIMRQMQNKKPFYFFFSLNNAYYCAPVYVSRMENTRHDTLRMKLSAIFALMLLLVPYLVKLLEAGMGWDLSFLGVYPRQARGIAGIFTHPLIHADAGHLLANTPPLFFLSWCLFYFYRQIAASILACIWVGCGLITFLIGHPGWHVGASGVVYGLAFFLFFSGVLRRYVPLMAISLLVTFLYGSLVWNMFPQFAPTGTSWEGHLAGATAGIFCAFAFRKKGPQRPDPFAGQSEADGGLSAADSPRAVPIPSLLSSSRGGVPRVRRPSPGRSSLARVACLFDPPRRPRSRRHRC